MHRRILRMLLVGLVALPLLTTGPCLTTAQQSIINGFFNAVTAELVDQASTALGLTPAATPGTSTTG